MAQSVFLEDLLKPDDIGIHRQDLIRHPIDFPRMFFRRVGLEPVILLIRSDQVFDIERREREMHGIYP